ncbi:ROK family protein [Hephaestia sp. GCM10023244]|uniref:ROK family protein n=1 Tax=unclassified Hephaestia TaxID=2631281 RepID=UPI0020776145|nr:ROK family protein [Hephaestia sp. MAHUQ-44]MCM8732356.1 ROK family protein [Hephaestia sp. MAHUQ-44]
MVRSPLIAGLELGGTKCVAILGTGPDDVRAFETVPTTDPMTTLAALEQVLDGWRFDAIGVASFGPLDLDPHSPRFGSISATPKPGWTGTDLTRRFMTRYDKPLAIQTDVIGAALAEQHWGAAQGLASHCYITIGTGVGVGLISGGRPVQGAAHGEAGHMHVRRAPGDDFAGTCPFHGDCVEGLVSGPAIARRFGRPGRELADDGSEWDLFVHDLTGLLHNLVVTAAPERIAIGGGVIASRERLFPKLRSALVASIGAYGSLALYADQLDRRLGPPGLAAMAGPLGALAMGLQAVDARG